MNNKYCPPCVFLRRKKNIGMPQYVTPEMLDQVINLAGTMLRKEVAKEIGISDSDLKRVANTLNISLKKIHYKESDILEVRKYYLKHGRPATEEKFPNIKVRTIIERHGWIKGECPRQKRWTDQEIVELAKFAGLISFKNQAEYFRRPRANEGAISSAWNKKFKTKPGYMHGLPLYKAKIFLSPDAPTIRYQEQERGGDRKMVLFCDAINYLRPDCPDFVRDAIKAMAEFQHKLFGEDPRFEIENILEALI